MDERELERLLNRYADQLSDEELEAAVPAELRERLRTHVEREIRGSRRIRRLAVLGPVGLAACVALIVFLLVPQGLIKEFELGRIRVRDQSPEPAGYRISLKLHRPAYARVVVFDAHGEPLLVPFDDAAREYVRRVEHAVSVEIDRVPRPGAAEALFVMVIASPGPSPTREELLRAMTEQPTLQTSDDEGMARELGELARKLESRFDSVARFKRVPAR